MKESLPLFLAKNDIKILESKIHPEQKLLIKKILSENTWIKNVLEIGFNAGHSADHILSQREDVKLMSVDINKHSYVKSCSEFISQKYLNRFKIKIGDSKRVLPKIRQRFDFIFIDGGHESDTTIRNIINCRSLSTKRTIVLLNGHCAKKNRIISLYRVFKGKRFINEINTPTIINDNFGWVLYKYV